LKNVEIHTIVAKERFLFIKNHKKIMRPFCHETEHLFCFDLAHNVKFLQMIDILIFIQDSAAGKDVPKSWLNVHPFVWYSNR